MVRTADLGTAILVVIGASMCRCSSQACALPLDRALRMAAGAIGAMALIHHEPQICKKEVSGPCSREYQKDRVCTLLDPTKDRKGNGFHVIQGKIAIGSGRHHQQG